MTWFGLPSHIWSRMAKCSAGSELVNLICDRAMSIDVCPAYLFSTSESVSAKDIMAGCTSGDLVLNCDVKFSSWLSTYVDRISRMVHCSSVGVNFLPRDRRSTCSRKSGENSTGVAYAWLMIRDAPSTSAVSYAAVAAANLNGVRGDVIRRSGDQAIR